MLGLLRTGDAVAAKEGRGESEGSFSRSFDNPDIDLGIDGFIEVIEERGSDILAKLWMFGVSLTRRQDSR